MASSKKPGLERKGKTPATDGGRSPRGAGKHRGDEVPAPRVAVTDGGLLVTDGALGLIGRTPLVALRTVSTPAVQVLGKVEFMNPAGSVKDRPAMQMILAAEAAGLVGEGATIVEATSGNTGISLAMIAAVRGYRCVLVMPEDMSVERRYVLQAYGAEIVLTPGLEGMGGAVSRAHELLAETPGAFMPSQFENAANPEAHALTTGREILAQTRSAVAVFVAGVGTGGTISGVGRALKAELGDQVRIVAVEPAGSAVLSGKAPGPHGIQGLGAGFVPNTLDRSVIDDVVTVTDREARQMAQHLARREGLLVGPSAGANVHAAAEVARAAEGGPVVTILCDTGERYLVS